ncbi:hypothetical protein C8Q80DRAFT_1186571 [Daedaleopsis nitida]|nr:hypothetical protein C8Q80DRAFT_1186571 [Daedaleopsis nitida]
MARNLPKAIDAIDKSRPPRRHIILQTLPPIVFSTPTSSLTVRFAMTTPIVKSNRVSSSSDGTQYLLRTHFLISISRPHSLSSAERSRRTACVCGISRAQRGGRLASDPNQQRVRVRQGGRTG